MRDLKALWQDLQEGKVPGLDPVERFVLPPEDDDDQELVAKAAEAFAEGGEVVFLHDGEKIPIPAEVARGLHMLLWSLADGEAAELKFVGTKLDSMFGSECAGLSWVELEELIEKGVIKSEPNKHCPELKLVRLVDLLAYRKAKMEEEEAQLLREIREEEALGIMQHEYDRLGLADLHQTDRD